MSMSIMTFMNLDFWSNTFITVLNMSITASYVASAILLARLLLKKTPKVFSYVLWSVVLFRLLCPVSFSTPFSLLGLAHPTTQSDLSTFQYIPQQYIPQEIGMMPVPTVDTGIDSIDTNPLQIWLALGTLVWLTGMGALLIYAAISYYRLKKQIGTATLVSANYLDPSNCGHYAQKIAGNLTSHVYETDRIRSPFVCGFIQPKIYLPLSLSPSEREYILCHEMTHIGRRDYLLKPLAFLALVLHWFNPLMWLCFALMTKDMEMSCDERVIREISGDRNITGYGSSLLALATPKKMPSPIPLAFGESNVKTRIKNILHYQKPAFGVIIAAIIAVICLAIALLSNPFNGFSIYEHPETKPFISPTSLQNPAKLYIVDWQSEKEYLLTDAKQIAQVTTIIEDMRLAKKQISKARGGKSDSRYSISYYDDVNHDIEDYRFTIHVTPVWIDNNVKPTYRFNLLNEKKILERLATVITDIESKNTNGYDLAFLLKNKTPYLGNHIKVGALLNGMPLPAGVTRDILELSTSQRPYRVTYRYILTDDAIKVSEEQFWRNSLLLFALIDNVDEITHLGYWQNKALSSTPFRFSYTRANAEKIAGGDIRQFAENEEKLAELIEIVQNLDSTNFNSTDNVGG